MVGPDRGHGAERGGVFDRRGVVADLVGGGERGFDEELRNRLGRDAVGAARDERSRPNVGGVGAVASGRGRVRDERRISARGISRAAGVDAHRAGGDARVAVLRQGVFVVGAESIERQRGERRRGVGGVLSRVRRRGCVVRGVRDGRDDSLRWRRRFARVLVCCIITLYHYVYSLQSVSTQSMKCTAPSRAKICSPMTAHPFTKTSPRRRVSTYTRL